MYVGEILKEHVYSILFQTKPIILYRMLGDEWKSISKAPARCMMDPHSGSTSQKKTCQGPDNRTMPQWRKWNSFLQFKESWMDRYLLSIYGSLLYVQ